MSIKQISVFVSNMAGGLADVSEIIAKAGVDIRALSIADTTDFGILRLIVDNPEKAIFALNNAGYIAKTTDVIAAHIDDEPGGLSKVLRALSDEGISIEYAYAFVSRKSHNAYVVFRLDDNNHAENIFNALGIKLASSDELYNL